MAANDKKTTKQTLERVKAWANQEFVRNTVNNLVNYYLKSETYTKAEVQQLLNAIKQFTYQVAPSLPTASADTMNVIYLVPTEDPKTKNVKDEFITIDNGAGAATRYTWEQIGSTQIDLSGYYTSAQTDAAITAALNSALANYTTTTNLNTLLSGKVDKVSGKGLSTNDYTNEEKTKLGALPTEAELNNEFAISGVYDVSAKNPTAGPNNDGKFTLDYILDSNNVNTLIPTAYRKGGMSIKFIQSSDNKYVQYFLTKNEWSTNVTDWEKLNLEEEVSQLGQEVGLISIPSNQIELTWEANYYYDSTGTKISYSAPELKVAQVDVSSLIGKALHINCACIGWEYCLFVDNNSVVLDSWQQNGVVRKIVPTSAKYLLLTNIFSQSYVLNPYMSIDSFVSFDTMVEQETGDSELKTMSQKAITKRLTFVYKNISIDWEQFYYWKSDGQKEYVSPSEAGNVIFASQKIDVSNYVGLDLTYLVYNDGDAYSLFLDENNNVLEYWHSQKTEGVKIIPSGAKWLCLSCFIDSSYVTNPYAKIKIAGDISNEFKKVLNMSDITPSSWDAGYYYTKYGVKTELSGVNILKTAEVSISEYHGKEVEINVYCEGVEYCLFVTSNNSVIKYFQPQTITREVVPNTADKLLLTNVFRESNGVVKPYVFATTNAIEYITDCFAQNSGNDRAKTMSQKAITDMVGSIGNYKIDLSGKIMAFLGDSITAISNSYPNYVVPYYNAIQRNLGIGGTAITRGIRSNPFIERVTQANIADADCLCVLGGINDFLLGATLGVPFVEETITGSRYVGTKRMIPSVDSGGNYTFCGCLHELINAIRDIKPTIPLLFITPLQESYYDSQDYEYPASFEQNAAGCYQKDYVDAIKQICQYYSIPVLDAFGLSGIDFKNDGMVAAYCWADRLHPSAAGSAFLAALVVKYINQHLYII